MKIWDKIKTNFDFNGVNPVYFWKSEWDDFNPNDTVARVSLGYLIYRFVFACYFVGCVIHSISYSNLSCYFIFYTNWTFSIQFAYSLFYFFRLLWLRFKKRKRVFRHSIGVGNIDRIVLPWPERIIWVLINVNSVLPYGVTLGSYFGAWVIPGQVKVSMWANVSNMLIIALNSPIALLDSAIMAVPIRITHAIFPILVYWFFCMLTGIYGTAGGKPSGEVKGYVFPIEDWVIKPERAIWTSLTGILFTGAAHATFCYGVYRLRVKVFKKACKDALVVRPE